MSLSSSVMRDPNTNFEDFCGGHLLNFSSVDVNKADFLVTAMTNGISFESMLMKFEGDIDEMAQTAAYAFSLGNITREETASFLRYREMIYAFGINGIKEINLLDADGEYTEEARSLSDFISSPEHFETFRDLLKKKARSEQRAFVLTLPEEDLNNANLQEFLQVARKVKIVTDFNQNEDRTEKLVLLSFSAQNALTQTIYGPHAKLLLPRLGKFTIDDIERSIRLGGRYAAVSYPGIQSSKTFHQVAADPIYLGLHDEAHRRLISTIKNPVYNAFLYAIDAIRDMTKFKWSKEIWDSIDMEVGVFLQSSDDSHTTTDDFIKLLSAPVFSQDRPMGLFNESPYNDTTWLLLIHMVLHTKEWEARSIFPSQFPKDSVYQELFDFVETHKNDIEKEVSPAKQVAIIKSKYFKLSHEVGTKNESICFAKQGNYIQVEVDNKPIMQSKEECITLNFDSVDLNFLPIKSMVFNATQALENRFPVTSVTNRLLKTCSNEELKTITPETIEIMLVLIDKKLGKISDADLFKYFKKELMIAPYLDLSSLNLRQLIKEEKLTLPELKGLSQDKVKIERLKNKALLPLILKNRATVAQLVNASDEIINELKKEEHIYSLVIECKKLDFNQLEKLSPASIKILCDDKNYMPILEGKKTVVQVIASQQKPEISLAQQGLFGEKMIDQEEIRTDLKKVSNLNNNS